MVDHQPLIHSHAPHQPDTCFLSSASIPHAPTRRTSLIGTILLLSSLLASASSEVSAQQPPTARLSNALDHSVKSPPSLELLAVRALKASCSLRLAREGGVAHGSATLIVTPPAMKPLLYPDEVLAVSVAHNFAGWIDICEVQAILHTSLNDKHQLKNPVVYGARLIDRFNVTKLGEMDCDISLLAIRLPEETRGYFQSQAIPLAAAHTKMSFGDVAVATGCGAYFRATQASPPSATAPLPTPSWRAERILNTFQLQTTTQYGEVLRTSLTGLSETTNGDSGGGFFRWNTAIETLELVGVCTAGSGEIVPDPAEFDGQIPNLPQIVRIEPGSSRDGLPEGAKIFTSVKEQERYLSELRNSHHSWALSANHRSTADHVSMVHELIGAVSTRYSQLVNERERLSRCYEESCQLIRSNTVLSRREERLLENLRILSEPGIKTVERQIEALKPTR